MIQFRTLFTIILMFFITSYIFSETNHSMHPKIKLFVYPSCPYCNKVIHFLKKINKLDQITVMDATNPTIMQELILKTNNNTQCPYLFDEINNIGMHESDDIIAYFANRF